MPTAVDEERPKVRTRPAAEVVDDFLESLKTPRGSTSPRHRGTEETQREREERWQQELRRSKGPARDHQSYRRGGPSVSDVAKVRTNTPTDGVPSPAIAPRGPLAQEPEPPDETDPEETPTGEDAGGTAGENTPGPQPPPGKPQPDEATAAAPTPAKPDSGPLEGVNESYEPFPNAPGRSGGAGGGKAVAAGAAGALIGAAVGGPAGAAIGAEAAGAGGAAGAAGVAGAETGAALGSRAGATAGAEAGAGGGEAGVAQELRAGKVQSQKEEQQKTNALFRGYQQVQEAREAFAQFTSEAQVIAERAYKQVWQAAQEAVEDWALTMTDLFLVSGPITVGLYLIRWMGGNMMGEMFTKEVRVPVPPGLPGGEVAIRVKVFPPYTFGDLQDNERHFKFLIVGAATFIIYGFLIMVIYYWTHWLEAILLAIRTGWSAIIDLLRAAFVP